MRKKTMRIVAVAAVAATPAFAFADDVGAPERQAQQFGLNPFTQQQLFPTGTPLSAGKFTLTPQVQLNPGPEADVDATWVGLGASASWFEAANWSTNPQVPDGTAAIARFKAPRAIAFCDAVRRHASGKPDYGWARAVAAQATAAT